MDLMQKVELMLKERDTILQRFTDQKRVLRERAGVDVSNGFSNQTKPTQPNPTLTYPDLILIWNVFYYADSMEYFKPLTLFF